MSHFNEILDQYIASKRAAQEGNPPPYQLGTGATPQIPTLPYTPSSAAQSSSATGSASSAPSGTLADDSNPYPVMEDQYPDPETMLNDDYLNAILMKFIGQKVHIEFLIGTNSTSDRNGYLLDVGANYIVLNELNTDDLLICDFYSIKFVRIYL